MQMSIYIQSKLNVSSVCSFVCITDNATTVKNGSIVLTVNEMYTATSEESFNYVVSDIRKTVYIG